MTTSVYKGKRNGAEQIDVGPYTFVQAVEVKYSVDGRYGAVPIPDTFAIPGMKLASRKQIERWAKEQCYKIKYQNV